MEINSYKTIHEVRYFVNPLILILIQHDKIIRCVIINKIQLEVDIIGQTDTRIILSNYLTRWLFTLHEISQVFSKHVFFIQKTF